MLKIGDRTRQIDMAQFGIRERQARDTVVAAEDESVLEGDGVTYSLTLKTHDDGRTLIALISHKEGSPDANVTGIFPIPDAVGVRDTPLDTFTALCERYGIEFTINGESRTLLVFGQTPEHPDSMIPRLTNEVRRNMSDTTRREVSGISLLRWTGEVTDIGILCFIDTTAIAEDA